MIDFYYWPTPNGWKVAILLEELGVEYCMIPVRIGKGDQFKPEFLAMCSDCIVGSETSQVFFALR